jgi:hypothetical protein
MSYKPFELLTILVGWKLHNFFHHINKKTCNAPFQSLVSMIIKVKYSSPQLTFALAQSCTSTWNHYYGMVLIMWAPWQGASSKEGSGFIHHVRGLFSIISICWRWHWIWHCLHWFCIKSPTKLFDMLRPMNSYSKGSWNGYQCTFCSIDFPRF